MFIVALTFEALSMPAAKICATAGKFKRFTLLAVRNALFLSFVLVKKPDRELVNAYSFIRVVGENII